MMPPYAHDALFFPDLWKVEPSDLDPTLTHVWFQCACLIILRPDGRRYASRMCDRHLFARPEVN